MKHRRLAAPSEFESGFENIRVELDIPASFPEEVLAAAEAAADRFADSRQDDRALPLIAIDPPGAQDLDQAFHAERRANGYRVFYAIADVAAFVTSGDRKSTRLNFSHTVISYAVFCLKKKKDF